MFKFALLPIALPACVSFPIRRSFVCGEGVVAATATATAAVGASAF